MSADRNRNLLICAAIDFSGGRWFADSWERIVAGLALGKAGDIGHHPGDGAAFCCRADLIPGSERPRTMPRAFRPEADGSTILLAGRIMDRAKLAAKLGGIESDDAALYAAAYRKWGSDCDRHIVGEYAVVQWFPGDRRVRLARSPLRAPPLHVWREAERMVVSSTPRSIFAAGHPARIDAKAMADLALFNMSHLDRSLFEGLSRVTCGSEEIHSAAGSARRTYWSIGRIEPSTSIGRAEAAVTARELLNRAVAANLDGVRRPAVSLSGGLDSQAVAVGLADAMGANEELRSFTSVPLSGKLPPAGPGLIYDESDRVRALAAMHPNIVPEFIEAADARFGADLDSMFLLGSRPPYNEMNMHWVHAIYRRAAQTGCDVVFTGDFGDPGLSYDGLTLYPQLLRRGKLGQLASAVRERRDGRFAGRRMASLAVMPLVPATWRNRFDRMRNWHVSPFSSWCPLDPENTVAAEAFERAGAEGHDVDLYPPATAAEARRRMIGSTISEGPETYQALRLLHGVETRDPLAYRPLFEFCLSLPDEIFAHGGRTRWLAREVLRGRVPEEVTGSEATAIQSADFLARLERDRGAIIADAERLDQGAAARAGLDMKRLARDLRSMDAPDGGGPHRWLRLACAVPRGMALGRFVQYVEGSNHG